MYWRSSCVVMGHSEETLEEKESWASSASFLVRPLTPPSTEAQHFQSQAVATILFLLIHPIHVLVNKHYRMCILRQVLVCFGNCHNELGTVGAQQKAGSLTWGGYSRKILHTRSRNRTLGCISSSATQKDLYDS